MCGIVGIASIQPVQAREWLELGRDKLIHRGPDGAGIHWSHDGQVGLAHRRLAIIDLSEMGHQPMVADDGNLMITFNGEIYNFEAVRDELIGLGHSFGSTSDTEVVLLAYRQWGRDAVERLHGMFAFAIYDCQNKTLFCARDRAGEKPFFYYYANGSFRFASELKALLVDPELPRKIRFESLDHYLAFGYSPGDSCILEGFEKLAPAHALEFNCRNGKLNVYRYWQLPELDPHADQISDEDLLDELETRLEDSVQRQLNADVPVGVLLSGGVDSSVITALAARQRGRISTFTVGFPETPEFDETSHANLIARTFDTDHTVLEPGKIAIELLLRLARQFDEPIGDSSMLPTFLVSEQISKKFKVALGGDGGDELFGGYYSASQIVKYANAFKSWNLWPRKFIAGIAKRTVPWRWPQTILGFDSTKDIIPICPKLNDHDRKQLLGHYPAWQPSAMAARMVRTPATLDPVQRMTRYDFGNYMPEDILVKVDRSSMLNSLEVRAPLLDVSVIEFAFGRVPSRLKATQFERKILLKRLAARLLPKEFDFQRKRGFAVPVKQLIVSGPWRELFESVLYDPGCCFSKAKVEQLYSSHLKQIDYSDELFKLCLFELWRREYRVEIS